MEKIRIAISGYGNLGRGVELAVSLAQDMELVGVFTRRAPETVVTATGAKVVRLPICQFKARRYLRTSTPLTVLILTLKSLNILPIWIKWVKKTGI